MLTLYICIYCIAATSLLYVVERLDIIAKQAALQFVVDSLRTDVRIGSDTFCVRLLLSTNGDMKDVQIYHGVGVRDLHSAIVSESRVSFFLLQIFLFMLTFRSLLYLVNRIYSIVLTVDCESE